MSFTENGVEITQYFAKKTDYATYLPLGAAMAAGNNSYGQLGQNNQTNYSSPVVIPGYNWIDAAILKNGQGTVLISEQNDAWFVGGVAFVNRSIPTQVGTLNTWNSIADGANHVIALQTGGTLWSWGLNSYGQVGNNSTNLISSPIQIGASSSWTRIGAGGSFSVGAASGGQLWSWGNNSFGQLGTSNQTNYSSPIQIGSLPWSSLSEGGNGNGYTTSAIKTDGTLWMCGYNQYGQLGLNDLTNRSTLVQVGTPNTWSKVSSNYFHTAAIQANGTLWSWGSNSYGQLGLSDLTGRSSPVQVGTLNNWSQISSNDSSLLAIKSDGTLWACGWNQFGQLGIGDLTDRYSLIQVGNLSNWSKISNGPQGHVMAIKTDGTLWAWGIDSNGQLGLGDTFVNRSTPVQVGSLSNWSQASAGGNITMAIKTDGTLWAWGQGGSGQLGLGDLTDRSSPVQIGTLSSWSNVVAGMIHTLAIQTNGTLWAWGSNNSGQLGQSNTTDRSSPVQVGALSNWSKISTEWATSIAIKTDGTLWAWGYGNAYGNLGNNSASNQSSPLQVGGSPFPVSKIACGYLHTTAINTNGTLWAWGNNSFGQLGQSDSTHRSSPVQVTAGPAIISAPTWASIKAGFHMFAGIQSNGTLWAWGNNLNGQLGQGNLTHRSVPTQIGTASNWSQVEVSRTAGISAIDTTGALWVCGYNLQGQLGLGDTTQRNVLTQVGTLTNWKQAVMGYNHTAAVKTDGTLWTWGINSNGALGLNTSTARISSPVQVGTLSNWLKVAAGFNCTFGIKTDSTLWACGYNVDGELANNSTTAQSSPIQIGLLSTWAHLSTWDYNIVAVQSNGTLWSWGYNFNGQLGLSDQTNRSSPVQVGSLSTWTQQSSMGPGFVTAIQSNGTLWTWGSNTYGQLGNNSTVSRSSPAQVGTLSNWLQVSSGVLAASALQTDSTLWVWGVNTMGSLGLNSSTTYDLLSPVQMATAGTPISIWTNVSCGSYYTAAINTNGSLWTWGGNSFGQLGQNNLTNRSSPVQIITGPAISASWAQINFGYGQAFAIQSNGTLWAWGRGEFGALGLGDVTNRSSPTRVGTLSNWSKIASAAHVLAVKTDGTLWSWGNNSLGVLGQGDSTDRSSPTQVGSLSNWSQVASLPVGSIAIKTDGTLWSWGGNTSGQLGLNTSPTFQVSSPVQVGGLSNWSQLAFGDTFWISIKTDSTLWACGYNVDGELGNNSTTAQSSPIQIGTLSNWASIGAAAFHCVAIQSNGTLWAWGYNGTGQLGQSDMVSRSTPTQIGTLSNWSQVAPRMSSEQSNVIKTDGTLWAWGMNTFGELGNGDTTVRSSPIQIGTLSNWSQVYSNLFGTIGRRTDGTIWTWGSNTYGHLGLGDTTNRSVPTQIGILISNWSQISCGYYHAAAINTNGTLWTWGSNSYGQLGTGNTATNSILIQVGTLSNWSQISLGYYHTVATQSNGTLWAWGRNDQGQLGLSDTTNRSSPVQVGVLSNWSQIAGGQLFSSAINSNNLYTWGMNTYGQLGVPPSFGGSNVPVKQFSGYFKKVTTSLSNAYLQTQNKNIFQTGIDDIPLVDATVSWTTYDTGLNHFIGVKTDGTAWVMGNNSYGQLGLGDQTYRSSIVQIGSASNWVKASAADYGSMLVDNSYNAWTFGKNDNYQLGLSDSTHRSSPVQIPANIPMVITWTQAAGGPAGNLAIRSDGTLWAWGGAVNGQLGTGNVGQFILPIQVGTASNWSQIFTSRCFSTGLKTDGTIWTCGYNFYGQLGISNQRWAYTFVQAGTASNWAQVSNSLYHAAGVQSNGTLWTWGFNGWGQLAQGDLTDRSFPTRVGALSNWIQVACGYQSTIALQSNGTLWAVGNNSFGLTGNNTTTAYIPTMAQVGTLSTWVQIAHANYHVMGLQSNGTLWMWANNSYGQLGVGDVSHRSSPTQVGTLSNWSKISAGTSQGAFVGAIKTDGTLWFWGFNGSGQLGVGDITNRSSPVQVGSLSNWSKIGPSGSDLIAIKTDGTMWTCGYNYYQLGLLSNFNVSSPIQIGASPTTFRPTSLSIDDSNLWSIDSSNNLWNAGINNVPAYLLSQRPFPGQIGRLSSWSQLSCGYSHNLALQSNGTLWAWGLNSYGSLGVGDLTHRSSPIQVGTLSTWSKVVGGFYHSYAFKSDNTLWVWGYNGWGQLGLSDGVTRSTPVQLGVANQWAQVNPGYTFTTAIQSNGTLWAWGSNSYGQLGLNTSTLSNVVSPVQVGTLSNWAQVSSGGYFWAGIQSNGTLWSCGYNVNGQLAQGNTTNRSSPVQIGALSTWAKVTCGNFYALAVQSNGTLWAWGSNGQYDLGINTTANQSSPVQVQALLVSGNLGVTWSTAFGGSNTTSFGIDTSGILWTWGSNSTGQLGQGPFINNAAIACPVDSIPNNWLQVSTLGLSMGGIKSNGTLWMWGNNSWGTVGDYPLANRGTAYQTAATGDYTQVSTNKDSTLLVKTGGTLWAYGNNTYGQLGTSDVTYRSSIVQIGTINNVTKIETKNNSTIFLTR